MCKLYYLIVAECLFQLLNEKMLILFQTKQSDQVKGNKIILIYFISYYHFTEVSNSHFIIDSKNHLKLSIEL